MLLDKEKAAPFGLFSHLVAKEISSHACERNGGSMTYWSGEVTGQNQNGRRRLTRGCSLAHVGKERERECNLSFPSPILVGAGGERAGLLPSIQNRCPDGRDSPKVLSQKRTT